MKRIPLTQGKFALVSDCDYVYLMQWKWCYHRSHDEGYASRQITRNGKRIVIWMHRVILEHMGYKDFANSDHINRDKLDNRRCNLRPATNYQNGYNRRKQNNNTSGYTGVYWNRAAKKWKAEIGVTGKSIFLGYYDDKKEAAKIYDKAALKYHGEFAVLNEVAEHVGNV
jgi:hypothetical protein